MKKGADESKKTSILLNIPTDLKEDLEAIAEVEVRSTSNLILYILTDYVRKNRDKGNE